MECFNDIAWCPFGDCKYEKSCEIFLTKGIEKEAAYSPLPLSIITERPPCYEDADADTVIQ